MRVKFGALLKRIFGKFSDKFSDCLETVAAIALLRGDTLDPKVGEVAGPTRAVRSSADGIQLGEYLVRTAKHMHLGTVVRSLTSNQGAHEQGNYFMHTSYQLRGTISHPSLGAWLSYFKGAGNASLPPSVYIGNASRHPGAGFARADDGDFPEVHSDSSR